MFFPVVLSVLFETGSPYVVQAGLKLKILLFCLSTATSTGVGHHTWPPTCFKSLASSSGSHL
jgi:hypothetical protein